MAVITGSSSLEPVFLQVGVGDAVLVEPHEGGWWVGQVIHCEGGARCSANSFFQITDVDTGRAHREPQSRERNRSQGAWRATIRNLS